MQEICSLGSEGAGAGQLAPATRHGAAVTASTATAEAARPLYTETATGTFTQAGGGSLKVRFSPYGVWGDTWVRDATFEVAPNAMSAGTAQITMAVTSGYSFGDVRVAFSPSGLAFQPSGTLTVTLWWTQYWYPTADQLFLEAQHITDGGIVTDAVLTSDRNGTYRVVVTIAVPGFSVYGLRD
ncbi:MAG: hypothetical protein ABIL09_10525 [Gemmatimonadota bacterium]